MSRVIEIFLEIVQIDSVSGQESQISQHIASFCKDLGFVVEVDSHNNVISRIPGNKKKEILLLNAHTDTVEPGRSIKPFIDEEGYIRSKGNTILGADNKSAVAALMSLAEKISNLNNYDGHPIEMVFTTSEESGNHGAHGLDYKKLKAERGYCSDASNRIFGDIIIASPFYNRFDITFIGKPAHASQSTLAQNVTKSLGNFLSLVNTGIINPMTIANVGIVKMGDVVNTIPGSAVVSGEVRSYQEEDLEKITDEIITLAKDSCEQGIIVKASVDRENGGLDLDETDDFVQKTVAIVKRYNKNPNLIRSWGCYDANVFSEHNITLLNIADGSMDSHTTDERIHTRDLENLVKLFNDLIS